MNVIPIIVTLLITTISLIIISKLPTGVEIDTIPKAIFSAIVFGLLNAFLLPVLQFLGAPLVWITLGLFSVIINAIVFGLAAWLVEGFRLRWGIWSALIGSISLAILTSLINKIFNVVA
jgi:putative membrane protein